MFGKSIKLFTLFGFKVQIDASWFILAILIIWSLAQGLFPYYYKDLSNASYWWMGVAGAAGLFLSIIAHEFMHSLIAQNASLPIKGITLFIFGGVAHMEDEPPSAKTEFSIAVAGPITSIVLGVLFYGIALAGRNYAWPLPVTAVFSYLGVINWVLAGFNLLPAFPLDGGRILRSVLWSIQKDLRRATKTASRIGVGFSILFMVIGAVQFISGNFIGGIWIFVIGMFLQGASRTSYRQLLIRQSLEGEPISRFMNTNPVTVPSTVTIEELVENYMYQHHFKMFPVVDNGELLGCVTTKDIKEIPRSEWSTKKVEDLHLTCSDRNTVDPDTDAVKVLAHLHHNQISRLLVVQHGKLVGIVTLRDIMQFLSIKLDLENY